MSLYRPRGSRIWWYDFVFNGERIRESSKSRSKTIARDAERARHRECEEKYNGLEKPEPPKTFSAAAAETVKAVRSKLTKKTMDIHERSIRNLIPFIGKKLVGKISKEDIEAVVADRRAHGDSNRYINMNIETLRLILRRYDCWEHLRKDYKKLKEPKNIGKELSFEEEGRLLDACRASISRELYPAVTLGLYAGLRHDEIRLLRWSQIDLEKACLTVGESKTETGEGRLVPLIGPALEAMREWAIAFPKRQPDHFVFQREKYARNAKRGSIQNL